tara:strand:+ start:666 stop:1193 length:528 start_codon:yes stop_codon:yes gene_type:complete
MKYPTVKDYQNRISGITEIMKDHIDIQTTTCPQMKAFGRNTNKCETAEIGITEVDVEYDLVDENITSDIKAIGKHIALVDKRIDQLNKENQVLKNNLEKSLNLDAGAQGMFIDVQNMYNYYLLGNWLLIFIMLGTCFFIYYRKGLTVESIKVTSNNAVQRATNIMPGITSQILRR